MPETSRKPGSCQARPQLKGKQKVDNRANMKKDSQMKIVIYCQHVLGIGHLFRSLEICRALSAHEVILVTGGPQVDGPLPDHVRQVRLHDLQMNREFKGLFSSRGDTPLERIKAERLQCLLGLFESEKPDVFLIELYPFGRKAFRFELDPVLHQLRHHRQTRCRVICSVRDILVEKPDALKHETRAVKTLNHYFDAVLVHADPRLAQINETFGQFDEIAIPVVYTGYIAPRPAANSAAKIRRQLHLRKDEALIIASAGSGSVGAPLLEAVMRAFDQLAAKRPCRLKVFSGPFVQPHEFKGLQKLVGPRVTVEKFTPDFLSLLAAADLSVSMGGYNTTMNILATGVPALVWPFAQNREQGLRSGRLDRLGALTLLGDEDLRPGRLADLIDQKLTLAKPPTVNLDLDGAVHTARWLEDRLKYT
jgi:predicted glycosyltransferase